MKVWKLVSGILSIIIAVFMFGQSQLVGFGQVITESDTSSSGGGIIAAILILAAGIVSIAVKKGGKGGAIAILILFLLGMMFTFPFMKDFPDLGIYGGWCTICAFLALISAIQEGHKNKKAKSADTVQ